MNKYKFSIIIPVAKNEDYFKSIQAIKKSNYPKSLIEVIIVRGNRPSEQRNIAAKKAKGDILYFLDNDSLPQSDNLKIINDFFQVNKEAVLIGGPSLHKEDDSLFQKAESIAFGSFIGSSFSRSRYYCSGRMRESNELELILCNMAVRKDIFLKLNGFITSLYPNEENELMNRIRRTKGKIYYLPRLTVFRSHRKNVFKLIKQILSYGRGRGEQTAVHISNLTFFPIISLGFDAYITWYIIYPCSCILSPGYIYAGVILLTSFIKMIQYKNPVYFLYLPLIYLIIHTLYGIGFLYGIIKSLLRIRTNLKKFWYEIKWIKKIE